MMTYKKKSIFFYQFIVFATCISCYKSKIIPIEKIRGHKYVVVDKELVFNKDYNMQLKSKDTIFWISILGFDGKNVRVGDTIR